MIIESKYFDLEVNFESVDEIEENEDEDYRVTVTIATMSGKQVSE